MPLIYTSYIHVTGTRDVLLAHNCHAVIPMHTETVIKIGDEVLEVERCRKSRDNVGRVVSGAAPVLVAAHCHVLQLRASCSLTFEGAMYSNITSIDSLLPRHPSDTNRSGLLHCSRWLKTAR